MFDTESRPTLKLEALPYGTALAMFRMLFGSSFEAALLTRPAGGILAANAEACTVFGASEDALLQRSRTDAHISLADASDPRLAALLAERATSGRARGRLRLRRIDGSPFQAEVSSFLFLDEAGLATSVLTVRDLTPVRVAERAARDSAQRLSFALDAAEIGHWDMDLHTKVTRRSLRHDRCFGYDSPPAKWDYDTFLAHIDPDDRARVDACHQAGKAAGGDHDVEFRVTWPDGSLHWLWSKGRVHSDEDGRPVRMAGILLDVTARRLAAEALQSSEARLQLALRGSSDGLWDFDLRTQEPYYSPRWLQMVGLPETPSPLDGTLWLRLCHPDDVERVRDAFSGILAGHTDTYEIEFRLMHRDGHAVPVLSRGFVLRAADGTALRVSGVNTDLTVRNQLSEAQSARLAAEAANRAKSEFLSRMSHELRTPLNAILGFAQLLAHDRIDRISERQRSQIRHIEKGGWHLLNMVNEILDLARIESGHAQAKVEVVEVPALLRECTGLLRATADARSIRLECRPELAAVAVAGDRTLVQQVLLNLMGNAIKYTQPGGRVSVSSQRTEHDCVKILVTDNGPGLSEAQQAQLFQPFNRLGHENGTTPGTGIGLVISQRLAELMHGSLSVQSAPGQGSTFAVTLPAHPLEAGEQVALLDQAKTEAAASQQPGRVLYIEDDSANAELMQGFVEQRPLVDLEVQRNAEGGLAAAMRRQPDLILLDMQLPDLPGLDVLRRLRLHPTTAAVPVVVISASAMADSVAAATAAGALDYLAKPLRLETLLATLDRCLPAARLP